MNFQCSICGLRMAHSNVGQHFTRVHNLTREEYWLRTAGLDVPPTCANPTCDLKPVFISITAGYGRFCGRECTMITRCAEYQRERAKLLCDPV